MSNDSDDFLDLDGEDEGARRSAAQRLAEAQRLDGTYNPPVPERDEALAVLKRYGHPAECVDALDAPIGAPDSADKDDEHGARPLLKSAGLTRLMVAVVGGREDEARATRR